MPAGEGKSNHGGIAALRNALRMAGGSETYLKTMTEYKLLNKKGAMPSLAVVE